VNVNDGRQDVGDVDTVTSTGTFAFSWYAGSDPDGGLVAGYDWCVTPTSGNCAVAIRSGTSNGSYLATTTDPTPQLTPGAKYYSCVRTVDSVGLKSAYECSDGFTVSTTADICSNLAGDQPAVPDGLVASGSGTCVPPTDACGNIVGFQGSVPAGFHAAAGACEVNLGVTRLTFSTSSIKRGQKTLPTATVGLTRDAKLTFTAQRVIKGFKVGTKCVAKKPKSPAKSARCTLLVRVPGSAAAKASDGTTKLTLAPAFWRRLTAGSYAITATASAGTERAARTRTFTVRA